ncbi:MAG: transposase [Dehalococcoidia bacterium]|nr:transposase [Dehalococcoidia bacterium]
MKEARLNPGDIVLLLQDEASFYRQPSQSWLWASFGRRQPKMRYSHRSNTLMRVVGFLDIATGKVLAWDCSKVSVKRLAQFIRKVAHAYPQAKTIYLAWDNWPNHYHPVVLEALQEDPRLIVLPLPTYSPWLNNIEKLWRLLRQEVAHAHPWCDDFIQFRQTIRDSLAEFSDGSHRLLHYCDLSY